MFAYFGGPQIVDVMLSGFKPGSPVTSPNDLNRWFNRLWGATIRKSSVKEAAQFGIGNLSVAELFAVHAKIVELCRTVAAGETALPVQDKTLKTLLDQIPFVHGEDGGKPHAGTALPQLDRTAEKLYDDVNGQIAAGQPAPTLIEEGRNCLPEPRVTRATAVYADAID